METNAKHASSEGYSTVTRRECENFLQITAFRGLAFIRRASHWTESIFWALVLVGATWRAIGDVRKAMEEFLNEETSTKLGVIGLQKLMFDNAVICVDYDPRALNLSNPHVVDKANESALIDQLAPAFKRSPVELLNMFLKLFTSISLIESGRSADYERKVIELNELSNGIDVEQLQAWLKATKVTMLEIGSIVSRWLCHAMRIRIDTIRRGVQISSLDPCDSAPITWLGVYPFVQSESSEMTMCVDIGGKLVFESMLDRVLISVNTEQLFEGLSSNRSDDVDDDYELKAYIDFSGDPVSTDMTRDFMEFPNSGCLAWEVGIIAQLHLLDKRAARCNKTAKTRLSCFGGCDVLRYESTKLCNCTQLAWFYLYQNEPHRTMCSDVYTIKQQRDCRRAARSMSSFSYDGCLSTCLYQCEHRQYSISHASITQCYEKQLTGGVSLELIPVRFTVPIFEEHFSPTVSELLSRIGGTCGLWLGVGLLGICHALLFPLKLLARLLQQCSAKRAEACD